LSMNTISLRKAVVLAMVMGGSAPFADAAVSTYDPATQTVRIEAVDLQTPEGKILTFNATLALKQGAEGLELELAGAAPVATPEGARAYFDADANTVFIPSVQVGDKEYAATLALVPGSNPLRFRLVRLHESQFQGCPDFAQPIGVNACQLQGEYKGREIVLTNDTTWVLSGGVYIGGDNSEPATLTIEPGTKIVGQQAADFLYIRRGSKINAIGSPSQPIVMTGALEQTPGEWGGLVLAGNAPVNGCNEGVSPCVQFNEAITTESHGGDDPHDSSGILKYLQIRYAGYPVRPDQELNGLTLAAVGDGTIVDYVEILEGADDGVEMFGGTVNLKHMVIVNAHDDSLDWGWGWTGSAQYVLAVQRNDTDRCIEADNNENNFDSTPRAQPVIANFTCKGNPAGTQAVVLRRGTGVNIVNSVFTDSPTCIRVDDEATFRNAGTPDNLSGRFTVDHTIVNCPTSFDAKNPLFSVADWFHAQEGNLEGVDPLLDAKGMPLPGSPVLQGGSQAARTTVYGTTVPGTSFIGAFDGTVDWTAGWTSGL